MYVEKAIGFISSHHDNSSAEKLLNYVYQYIYSTSTQLPIERVICNITDDLIVKKDRTTIFEPLTINNGSTVLQRVEIFHSPRIPNIPVSLVHSRTFASKDCLESLAKSQSFWPLKISY